MKTKYVCRGLISLYVNFHNNRTMWSTKLHEKICRWGEKEKEPTRLLVIYPIFFDFSFICTWGIRVKAKMD